MYFLYCESNARDEAGNEELATGIGLGYRKRS
jgi:hypothetical protein